MMKLRQQQQEYSRIMLTLTSFSDPSYGMNAPAQWLQHHISIILNKTNSHMKA
jgi:hypothetical protein